MSFYSTLLNNPPTQPQEKTAEDAAPDNGIVRYTIDCKDRDKSILRLLQYIKKNSDPGHTFDVTVDPGSKEEKSFCIDGDGADNIISILVSKPSDDIIGLLLANLQIIKWICRDVTDPSSNPFLDEAEQKPPLVAIKEISDTVDSLLAGRIRDSIGNIKDDLKEIIDLVESSEKGTDGSKSPFASTLSTTEKLKWIKDLCKHKLRRIQKITEENPKK